MRAASPFGVWEQSVGQTFVSRITLLKIDKDDAGNLVFQYSLPDGSNPGREVFQAPSRTDPRAFRVLSMPNRPAGSFESRQLTLSADDRLVHRFTGTENIFTYNGDYLDIYINRGDSIRIMSRAQGPDDDSPSTGNHIYLPVTHERLASAMENRERQKVERERSRIHAQRRAAEREAESQATTNAILSGLASGFQQANQSNLRMAQQSRDFERDLNQKLRQIEQQKQQRDREAAAHADRIMAANAAAAQARAAAAAALPRRRGPWRRHQRAPRKPSVGRKPGASRKNSARPRKPVPRNRPGWPGKNSARKKPAGKRNSPARNRNAGPRRCWTISRPSAAPYACKPRNAPPRGLPSVIGIRPGVQPKVANCITVHFEARCPADRPGTGMTGSIWAYNGMGNCTETGDLPRKLACDVREAVVEVTNVTTCQ